MARRRKSSPAEDVMDLVALLPWWAGVTLAIVSYVWLHSIATRPLPPAGPHSVVQAVWIGLAGGLQYILPFVCLLGAVMSAIRRAQRAKSAAPVAPNSSATVARSASAPYQRAAAPEAKDSIQRAGAEASPPCPKCSKPMVRRVARQGASAGNAFWGCTDYPACKGTRPMA